MLGLEHLYIGYYGVADFFLFFGGDAKKCLMFGIRFELELGTKGEIGIYESVILRLARRSGH